MNDSEEGNPIEIIIDEEEFEKCDEAEESFYEDCYEFSVTYPEQMIPIDDVAVS